MAEPSKKSSQLEAFLEDLTGRSSAIKANKCIVPPFGCGRAISDEEMASWDELTRREFSISGMCAECQDSVFGGGDDDE